MKYSDNQLTVLAKSNPKELIRILTSPNVNTKMLASGAEILGSENSNEDIVLPTLKQLLKHVNALVREGAAIGISSFYLDKIPPVDVLEKLKDMSSNDPSPNLREYIVTMLQNFEDTINKS
jgi:HEAT repeat protein